MFDTSRKHLSGHLRPAPAVLWLMLLQAPLFLLLAAGEQWIWPVQGYWLPALLSLAMNLLSNILFIEAVRLAPFSLAIPVLSLTPVFSAIGGFLVLGERTSARQALGITIIVTATFLLGRVSSASTADIDNSKVRKGLGLMALVAAFFALTPVVDKICLQMMPASEHAFAQCLGIAAFVALYLKARAHDLDGQSALKNWRWLFAAVGFAAAALLTQLWAIQHVPVGMFEALKRSFGLVSALTIGYFVFKEPISKAKVLTVLAIGAGIAILLY